MRYKFLRFPGGKSKAVTLSYDDGVIEDLRLADLLAKYKMKCTFNLTGSKFKPFILSDEDVKNHILDQGHEVAIHGYFHRPEGTLRPIEGIRDVLDCRMELEQRFDRIIRGMAYPDSGIRRFTNNASYEKIKGYLSDLDIAYARTLGEDNNLFMLPGDWHSWMPTAHHKNPKLFEYVEEFISLNRADKIYGALRYPRLFYLWGHSYEFSRDDNWDVIENFCEKIANHDDIWYATNMEIYEYVTAYNSLIFSASETKVYNPTVYDIWFDVDATLYKIAPGETLDIK